MMTKNCSTVDICLFLFFFCICITLDINKTKNHNCYDFRTRPVCPRRMLMHDIEYAQSKTDQKM